MLSTHVGFHFWHEVQNLLLWVILRQKNKPNNPTNVINLKFRCMSWKVATVKKGTAEQSEAAAC